METTIKHTAKNANGIDAHIGKKINQLRLSQGLTRQDLAQKLGVTHQQLQKYEKGKNRIAASRLFRLAQILYVPVNVFFEGAETAHTVPSDMMERQRLCMEVMFHFGKIKHEKQQEALSKLIRSLAEQGS